MQLNRLTDHVWYLPSEAESHRPALGYVCCGKSAAIVDTGNSPDHVSLLYGCARSVGMPDPEYAILTHWHWDHVFGLSGSPAKSIASVLTNEKLINMQRWDWSDSSMSARVAAGLEIPSTAELIRQEMPMRHSFKVRTADMTFVSHCALRLNDIHCEMYLVGGPHSEDSVVVHVPDDGVLFLGDCYQEDVYTGGGSIRLNEFKQLLKRLDTFDAEWFVPGHEEPMSKTDFMEKMKSIESIGESLDGIIELSEGKQKLKKALKHDLKEDEVFWAECFITGNRYAYIHDGA